VVRVAGVLKTKALFTETIGSLQPRPENDVYIPLSTFGKRIPKSNVLLSELKQVTVKLESSGVIASANIIKSILTRRHFNMMISALSFLTN